MLWIDHVILGVGDLEAAARSLFDRTGLDSVPGGRHPGWGTGNRVAPLGESYVELLAAIDRDEAAANPLGQNLLKRVGRGDRLMAWCVAASDIEGVASRLGLVVETGSRVRPDGETLRWRSAGLSQAMERRFLPFFISWEVPPELHPGRAIANHRISPYGIAWVSVTGNPAELQEWVGGQELPVRVTNGPKEITGVGISTERGEVVI